MKQMAIYSFILSLFICNACVKQGNKQGKQNEDLNRIEQWGFPITEDYLQTYVGSFCYSTTYHHNETDYFIGYNRFLHTIDILDLTQKKPYKQIALEKEGNNALFGLHGIAFYKNQLIVADHSRYYCMDMDGKILSRKDKSEFMKVFEGYNPMVPGLNIFFSMYSFFLFNAETGEIAITLYSPNESHDKPVKILLISCENWEITESVDIAYPDIILKEKNLGVLKSVHAYPCADKIYYNIAASSTIYCIDRKTKETVVYEFPSSITKDLLQVTGFESEEEPSILAGYYFPLQYDSFRKKFWRIQMGAKGPLFSSMYADRPYGISCINPNMKDYNEYTFPKELELYPNSLFFRDGILIPYINSPAENDLVFYCMEMK